MYLKHFDELTKEELYNILQARESVFVVEQNCPYQEIDGKDLNAYHFWIDNEDGKILSYLRFFQRDGDTVVIGRVTLLLEAVSQIQKKYDVSKIHLEAQVYAKGLYEKAGFTVCGEEFLDDGIPHVPMMMELK